MAKAAGVGAARIRCHNNTWSYLEEAVPRDEHPGGGDDLRPPAEEEIVTEKDGMVTVPLSGTSLAAVLSWCCRTTAGGPRTRTLPSTGMNCGLSAAWPAVSTNAGGRHVRSAARWTLLVCPPLERPRRAAFRRRSASAPGASAPLPLGICFGVLPVSSFGAPPLWLVLLLLGGSLLQRGEDVLVQVHPGCVVVSARGGGGDAHQGQVHLTPLRRFRDQALQQGLEDTGVTPLPEAVVDSRPGTELLRHLPPLPARLGAPDHPLELLPQPLGIRAVLADRQIRLDELPFRTRRLPSRHARRSTGGTR